MLSWVALAIAGLAVAYAWKLQQELQTVTRRLDRYNHALFTLNDDMRQLREEMMNGFAHARAEFHSGMGNAHFDATMTVREAMALHPQAAQILAAFHLGGCSSYAVDDDASLAAVCREQGRDLPELLQTLNLLIAAAVPGQQKQSMVKIPNVELSF